jgi:hypothetical protein
MLRLLKYCQMLSLWWVTSSVDFICDGFLEVFGLIFGHVIAFSGAFRVLSLFSESNAKLATELGHASFFQYPFQIIIFQSLYHFVLYIVKY